MEQKHPQGKDVSDSVRLPDTPIKAHEVRFEAISLKMIRESALKTRDGAGPSGLDGDGWRRILCSSIANLTKRRCSNVQDKNTLELSLASRLIPLDKNPGLRLISIGETLRRIIGKTVARFLKQDVMDSVGSLQVCAGQDAGCEAATHALRDIYEQEECEAVMLIDASNAFNSVSRKAFLHNVKIICPSIATFTTNCYNSSSR